MGRDIYLIAQDIRRNWEKVHYTAEPYLEAMGTITSIEEDYVFAPGREIVIYFLSNASSFRGEDARRIKKELNAILKGR